MAGNSHIRLLSVAFSLAFLVCCVQASGQTRDDLSLFVSKFGSPDRVESSEYEKPRPPIVLKQLIYTKENVRVVFVPDAPVGSPPPYKGWKFVGFQDQRTNQVLKAPEVSSRMAHRK